MEEVQVEVTEVAEIVEMPEEKSSKGFDFDKVSKTDNFGNESENQSIDTMQDDIMSVRERTGANQ
jgi:hypothetical protein